jgi:membrane-bound lytic murein transglycosylase B
MLLRREVCEDAAVSIDTTAKPTAPSASRVKVVRPLVWTVGVGFMGLVFSVVAAVYADAIFPAQPPVPLLDPPAVAAVPEPTSGQETVQHVGSTGSVDPTWVDRVAKATGIPARALSAYAEADLDAFNRQPGCHLRWNTAAAYLCAKGRDLTTAAGWRSAVGSYNAPDAYAASVTDAANRYARASLA